MRSPLVHSRRGRVGLSVILAFACLMLGPLAAALEIHHALAAAGHDSHQHSDFDLCQWVQHHASGSLSTATPPIDCHLLPETLPGAESGLPVSTWLVKDGRPRAPPAR